MINEISINEITDSDIIGILFLKSGKRNKIIPNPLGEGYISVGKNGPKGDRYWTAPNKKEYILKASTQEKGIEAKWFLNENALS